MVIRDCNKDNKWSWVYITNKRFTTEIYFKDASYYVLNNRVLEFIKR
jgi:hypothetical protein